MKDIQLLFCILSLFAGVSAVSISIFIYHIYKKKSLRLFIAFMLSLILIQCAISLKMFSGYMSQGSIVPILSRVFDIIGTASSTISGLVFVNYLFGLKINNVKRAIYYSVFGFQLIGFLIYYTFTTKYIFQTLLRASVIIVIMYEIFIVLINFRGVINKELKRAIKLFILVTVIFFPLILIESYRAYIPFFKNIELIKVLALPLYLLIINILSIYFAVAYFNTPPFSNNNKLTDYFIKTYDITEKESQVIELVMEGLTYKQIAEKLFISAKTVDNHIQNIYKKLNVNSKLQLANFVRSNEK
jgi:DNA-binding CsgD family transcriptional regulator